MKPKALIDSGAFSAWTMKSTLDVAKYCDFLHENMSWIDWYIALDVIIPDDTERAAAEGFKNFQYMKGRGLNPMPVFHQGEPMEYLYKYLDAGCDYIGLAATSLSQKQHIDFWYAQTWAHLVNKEGLPLVRVHAFGDARERALRAFPWASCDSTSWAYNAQIHATFKVHDGRDRSHGKMRGAALSHRNDFRSNKTFRDVDVLDAGERDQLSEFLQRYGISEEVFNIRPESQIGEGTGTRYEGKERHTSAQTTMVRSYLMLRWYQELEARIKALVPNRYLPRGGFANAELGFASDESISPVVDLPNVAADPNYKEFNMYFVIGNNRMAYPAMRAVNHERILASYFYLRNIRFLELKAFVADPDTMVYAPGPVQRYTLALDEVLKGTQYARGRALPALEPIRSTHAETSTDIKLPGAGPGH